MNLLEDRGEFFEEKVTHSSKNARIIRIDTDKKTYNSSNKEVEDKSKEYVFHIFKCFYINFNQILVSNNTFIIMYSKKIYR